MNEQKIEPKASTPPKPGRKHVAKRLKMAHRRAKGHRVVFNGKRAKNPNGTPSFKAFAASQAKG